MPTFKLRAILKYLRYNIDQKSNAPRVLVYGSLNPLILSKTSKDLL